MKEHKWHKQVLSCAGLGINSFWKCYECGADGGPADLGGEPPFFDPFVADGSKFKVSFDCNEARIQIIEHNKTYMSPYAHLLNKETTNAST